MKDKTKIQFILAACAIALFAIAFNLVFDESQPEPTPPPLFHFMP